MRADSLSPTVSESWSHCLPGFKLTHTVHLVSSLDLDVVSTAADVLKAEDAAVERWVVTRCGEVLEQKIVLGEMTEKQAVRLRDQLAGLDGVLRARIEHQFVRVRIPQGPAVWSRGA
ncbi:MAG: hypothetical protein ACTHNZ_05450 [Trinickia sp.]|jgi:hypothetical protein|uniref:hypothetical protein n=1 Tax=Trinickia sp. TaxID=2571163 RepID=UPI003F7F8B9B